jgi:hypothetical protein
VWCDSDPAVKPIRIHQALQTASMINMAETAARYWIALVASLIALLSARALVAVFVQIVGNMKQLYL